MWELRYPHQISIIKLLLLLTGLALILPPAERIQVRATPIDGPRDIIHKQLDHRPYASVKDLAVVKPTTQLPVLDVQPGSATAHSSRPSVKFDGSTVHRLTQVVHETNLVILLTNGEQIKLYPLKENDLTPSGGYYVIKSKLNFTTKDWKRPSISDVGYVFDNRFCNSSNHSVTLESNCLVIFWLDQRNKFLRYGSYMFTGASRIELLSSKFNAHGNLKSLSANNMKTIWLDELPPIDLCKQANQLDNHLVDCEVMDGSMTVDRSNQQLNISLNVSAINPFQRDKDHATLTMSAYIRETPLNFQISDITSDTKDERVLETAVIMTSNKFRCQSFWLNENYELYSSNLAGQNMQLFEKLSSKPALKMLGQIHSYRDILFFSDKATKSIMSYNITHRAVVIRQSKPREERRKKFEVVEKLESTHQVLLVETPSILKFNIIDFKKDPWSTESLCKNELTRNFKEPRVIDDDLTDHLKKQKLDSDYEQHLVEDIMQLTLVILSILLVIFIVTDKARIKRVESDREFFVNYDGA